jgi:hypothetical protein
MHRLSRARVFVEDGKQNGSLTNAGGVRAMASVVVGRRRRSRCVGDESGERTERREQDWDRTSIDVCLGVSVLSGRGPQGERNER